MKKLLFTTCVCILYSFTYAQDNNSGDNFIGAWHCINSKDAIKISFDGSNYILNKAGKLISLNYRDGTLKNTDPASKVVYNQLNGHIFFQKKEYEKGDGHYSNVEPNAPVNGPTKEETVDFILEKLNKYYIKDWGLTTSNCEEYIDKSHHETEYIFSYIYDKNCFIINTIDDHRYNIMSDKPGHEMSEKIKQAGTDDYHSPPSLNDVYPKDMVITSKAESNSTWSSLCEGTNFEDKQIDFAGEVIHFNYEAEPNLVDRLNTALQHLRKLLGVAEPHVKKDKF